MFYCAICYYDDCSTPEEYYFLCKENAEAFVDDIIEEYKLSFECSITTWHSWKMGLFRSGLSQFQNTIEELNNKIKELEASLSLLGPVSHTKKNKQKVNQLQRSIGVYNQQILDISLLEKRASCYNTWVEHKLKERRECWNVVELEFHDVDKG